MINHRQPDLSDAPVYYISKRLTWQAAGVTCIRRHRWPMEVYHEEGKAEGLDQYQLRDWRAIERHVALVAVVWKLIYSRDDLGMLNAFLHAISFGAIDPTDWLGSTSTALLAIVIMSVWQGVGFQMVILLAAVQGVLQSLY